MRFNPILKRLKDLVDEKKDQIFYTNTFASSYLHHWRPGKNYTKIYSSKKNNSTETKKETFNFDRDNYFKEQLMFFLDGVENQSKNIDNLKDAKELLEKLIKFKENNKMIINSNNLKKN